MHFNIGVIIPPSVTTRMLYSYVHEAMAPYEENARGEGFWDWYVIGGHWDGWVHGRETNAEAVADNLATVLQLLRQDKLPLVLITPDGDWHDTIGDAKASALLARHRDCNVLILDAHT